MSKIVINSTSGDVFISDVGIFVSGNGEYAIPPNDYLLWSSSSDIINLIGNGTILVNDGTSNLSSSDAVDLIKGFFPKRVIADFGDSGGNLIDFEDYLKDSFGRVRTSENTGIFDVIFSVDKLGKAVTSAAENGGLVSHDANKKSMVLSVTSTTGSRARMRTKRYIPYHPGKSQFLKLAGNLNGAKVGLLKYIGQLDDDNGVYWFLDQLTPKVCIRSKVSGSVVNTEVARNDWNVDKFDGLGPSGITIDFSRQQIYIIDYQWQGSGVVRYGLSLGKKIYYCHIIYNANNISTPYSQTATLPLYAEIKNISNQADSMHMTCWVVDSEGGFGPDGQMKTISNGVNSRLLSLLNSRVPILSLRKQSAYHFLPLQILDASAFASSVDDFMIEFVINGTLSGANWVNINDTDQKDVSANGISGGQTIYTGYVRGSSTGASNLISDILQKTNDFYLGSNFDGTSDIFSVVATNLTLTASVLCTINYKEII